MNDEKEKERPSQAKLRSLTDELRSTLDKMERPTSATSSTGNGVVFAASSSSSATATTNGGSMSARSSSTATGGRASFGGAQTTRAGSTTSTTGSGSGTTGLSGIPQSLATAHSLLVPELRESAIEQMDPFELQEKYRELQTRYNRTVQEKDEQREVWMRRELGYKEIMTDLTARFQSVRIDDTNSKKLMTPLEEKHREVLEYIGKVQGTTTRILQDHQRDLIRAFRARLADVTDELERERRKNELGSKEWVEKTNKLTDELEDLRSLCDKLSGENKSVLKENRRIKRQLKTQEEDRDFLIKQLVAVKKENARLRIAFEQGQLTHDGSNGTTAAQQPPLLTSGLGVGPSPPITPTALLLSQMTPGTRQAPVSALRMRGTPTAGTSGSPTPTPPPPFGSQSAARSSRPIARPPSAPRARTASGVRPSSATGSRSMPVTARGDAPGTPTTAANGASYTDLEARYQAMIAKMKRQMEEEKNKHRATRAAHMAELSSRTQLQHFLKRCIEDVRIDIAQRNQKRGLPARTPVKKPVDPRDIPLEQFTPADRINVMEWLLSHDQVIFMLYDKMFPRAKPVHASQLDSTIDFQLPDTSVATSISRPQSSSGVATGGTPSASARAQHIGGGGDSKRMRPTSAHSSRSSVGANVRYADAMHELDDLNNHHTSQSARASSHRGGSSGSGNKQQQQQTAGGDAYDYDDGEGDDPPWPTDDGVADDDDDDDEHDVSSPTSRVAAAVAAATAASNQTNSTSFALSDAEPSRQPQPSSSSSSSSHGTTSGTNGASSSSSSAQRAATTTSSTGNSTNATSATPAATLLPVV